MKNLKIILAGLAALSFTMCTGTKDKQSDVMSISLWENTLTVNELNDYIDSLAVIPLSSDSMIVSVSSKIVKCSDGTFIYLSGGTVYSFDKSGKFKRMYGRKGRGPGEYLNISDIAISYDQSQVLCLDALNDIYCYRLDNGSFYQKIATDIQGMSSSAIMPIGRDLIGMFFPNPPMSKEESGFYCLKLIDNNGKVSSEIIERKGFNVPFGFNPQTHQISGNRYILSVSPYSDVCYLASEDGVEPFVYIDMGPNGIPNNYFDDGTDPWKKLSDAFESDIYKCPAVCTTDPLIYCSFFGKDSSVINVVKDKESGKGISWTSFGYTVPPMLASCADSDFLYFIYSEAEVRPLDEIQDPLMRIVTEKYSELIDNEGDPTIIKIRFKF